MYFLMQQILCKISYHRNSDTFSLADGMMVQHHHPHVFSKQHINSHICTNSQLYYYIAAIKSRHDVHVTPFTMESSQRPRRHSQPTNFYGYPGGASNDASNNTSKDAAAKNDAANHDGPTKAAVEEAPANKNPQ